MSPIDDQGQARVLRDKDSFFRDARGLLSMSHLIAFMAVVVGVMFSCVAAYGFLRQMIDWPVIGQYGVALLISGAGLEYGSTRIDASLVQK